MELWKIGKNATIRIVHIFLSLNPILFIINQTSDVSKTSDVLLYNNPGFIYFFFAICLKSLSSMPSKFLPFSTQ